jgi:uncharacterized membrane protein YheB (UPF0754 family)
LFSSWFFLPLANQACMQDTVRDLVAKVATQEAPNLWTALSPHVRDQVVQTLALDAESYITDLLVALQHHILNVVNLRHLVGRIVERDKGLLSEVFLRVGGREFVFVKNSGLYFGFLFGLPQVCVHSNTASGIGFSELCHCCCMGMGPLMTLVMFACFLKPAKVHL